MILRRYGTSYQSVDLNFDSKALNEVGFRRNRVRSIATEEFESSYVLVETHQLPLVSSLGGTFTLLLYPAPSPQCYIGIDVAKTPTVQVSTGTKVRNFHFLEAPDVGL